MSSPILPLDAADLVRFLLIVFTLAQLLSQTFWKPSGLAPAIEARSSHRYRPCEHRRTAAAREEP